MLAKLKLYASFVRVSHSVFALPFALVGALLAARATPLTLSRVAWIVGAMVSARSAAMGFNRLADARFDAMNPRTSMRELPRGALSTGEALTFVVVVLRRLRPLRLGAGAAVRRCSLRWRWRSSSGIRSRSATPGPRSSSSVSRWPWRRWVAGSRRAAAWRGNRSGSRVAIGTWVGGFDVLYACQDVEFDRAHGLRSMPSAVRRARGARGSPAPCTWSPSSA